MMAFNGFNGTLDWSIFLGNDSNPFVNDTASNSETSWKPQKIAAIVLSIIGIMANLSSILAISKLQARLTTHLRYVHKLLRIFQHQKSEIIQDYTLHSKQKVGRSWSNGYLEWVAVSLGY